MDIETAMAVTVQLKMTMGKTSMAARMEMVVNMNV